MHAPLIVVALAWLVALMLVTALIATSQWLANRREARRAARIAQLPTTPTGMVVSDRKAG